MVIGMSFTNLYSLISSLRDLCALCGKFLSLHATIICATMDEEIPIGGEMQPNAVDLAVFLAANLMNLLLAGMFFFRARRQAKTGEILGWAAVALAVPLAGAALLNALAQRGWPFWVLPLVTTAYCAVELLLDAILKIDFRHNRLLGPYLALYYLGLMAMIGYAFLVGKPYGFITLFTYFANLGVTAYSFSKVGHGVAEDRR